MQLTMPTSGRPGKQNDASIGRIVSVTGSKAIVLLDGQQDGPRAFAQRSP